MSSASISGSVTLSGTDPAQPFEEPWQAQALAAAMSLVEEGLVTATEWSEALGAAIRRAQARGDPDTGDTYYLHVLDAIETLLAEKNMVARSEMSNRKDDWEAAYRATPHGEPVVLDNAAD